MGTDKPLIAALLKARKAFRPALKTATNPHYKSKFVDLHAALDAVEDALSDADILLTQPVKMLDGQMIVATTLTHVSGDFMESQYPVIAASPGDPQKLGAAVTYARRYSLMAMLSIAGEDDDGESAGERESEPRVGKKSGRAPEVVEPPMPGRRYAREAQRRELVAALDKLVPTKPELAEKSARLWWVGQIVKRKIESTAELMEDEILECIKQAQEEA